MKPSISLVICTRNRAPQLERTLHACQNLVFDRPWEIVIINNGSTDQTADAIHRFANRSNLQVIQCHEARPGLSHARNRGIQQAQAPIIVFTDDDCYPDPTFLTRIWHCMADTNIVFCGGRVRLFDPADQPITIQESTQPRRFESAEGFTSGLILGANMSIRRDALLACRGFDERMGAGSRFKSGEDTDLLRRLLEKGFTGVYDPDVVVFHHHGRQTDADRLSLIKTYSWGRGATMAKRLLTQPAKNQILKSWYWHLRGVTLAQAWRELFSASLFAAYTGFSSKRCKHHPADSLR